MKFVLLKNMKMPTIFDIFIFIRRENFMFSWVEYETSFITSGASFVIFMVEPNIFLSEFSQNHQTFADNIVYPINSDGYMYANYAGSNKSLHNWIRIYTDSHSASTFRCTLCTLLSNGYVCCESVFEYLGEVLYNVFILIYVPGALQLIAAKNDSI